MFHCPVTFVHCPVKKNGRKNWNHDSGRSTTQLFYVAFSRSLRDSDSKETLELFAVWLSCPILSQLRARIAVKKRVALHYMNYYYDFV